MRFGVVSGALPLAVTATGARRNDAPRRRQRDHHPDRPVLPGWTGRASHDRPPVARPTVPLIGVYVLTGLFGWPLLVVIFLGLLDTSLGLRRHFRLSRSIGGKNAG